MGDRGEPDLPTWQRDGLEDPGKFSGLHLLCIEYVGFKLIDPSVDLGFDLTAEYAAACEAHGK